MPAARRLLTALALCLLSAPAALAGGPLWQVSTGNALVSGHYDGILPLSRLLEHGDFGLGTFDRLDGELCLLDGEVYQVTVDGAVHRPSLETTTPFAVVAGFEPEAEAALGPLAGRNAIEAALAALLPGGARAQLPVAVRVDGRFARVRVRSVPAQEPPYRRLADVVDEEQRAYTHTDVDGTLLGFWCPQSEPGFNIPGFHLHFLTDDRTAGGHVLDADLAEGTARIDVLDGVVAVLPPGARQATATAHEMEQVER